MTRKLLPFEHELIAALGVSKDEYLEFVALYENPNFEGKPTATGTEVAIVLAVIGLLSSAASVLLMPKPNIPAFDTGRAVGGQGQTRDERFSPRFGFNSTQELAAYGDPVNLVYANRGTGTGANPNGGVRVTASLLWSAVRSYGSSQFIQMLMMLAGGAVEAIDTEKTAFGQTPLRDMMSENIWTYFDPGGTGYLQRLDEVGGKQATDPTAYGDNSANPYRLQPSSANTRVDGFSQAYSPTTANTVGIYGVVPLNINLYIRNEKGAQQGANLGITASGISWTSSNPTTAINLNDVLSVTFAATPVNANDSDVVSETKDARRSLLSVFDSASTFKLGTALFRVTDFPGTNIDEKAITIKLKCIQAGRPPGTAYASTDANNTTGTLTDAEQTELNRLNNNVQALLNEDQYPSVTGAVELADARIIRNLKLRQDKVYVTAQEAFVNGIQYYGRLKEGYYVESDGYRGSRYYTYRTVPDTTRVYVNFDESHFETFPRALRPGYYQEGSSFYRLDNVYVKKRDLTANELAILRRYIQLRNLQGNYRGVMFYTKALVRIATAKYETLSPSHIIDFALKAIVFKRISGRQLEYGSDRARGYPISDNGIKTRVTLFKLRYRQVGQNQYATVPGIFAISRAADNENFIFFKFNSGITTASAAVHWEFEFEPVMDPISETAVNDIYYYIANAGTPVTETLGTYRLLNGSGTTPSIQFIGQKLNASDSIFPPKNNNPGGLNEWDLFSNTADTQINFSFDSGPEITITAVTEQLIQPFTDYDQRNSSGRVVKQLYDRLALLGFNAYSGKTIQDLRSFSVFATQGRSVRRIRTSGNDEGGRTWGSANYAYYPANPNGASSLAPDIFLDTVLDKQDGIGHFAVVNALDLKQLAITKRFCIRNNLFMDCVIADPRSWREFWVEVAPFSLLEFARIGGRETLVPAVPYNATTGEITRTVNVSALFNQGNILEDSYKEEYIDYGSNVQDIVASVVYTEMPQDAVFAKKRSVEVVLTNTIEADAIRQTFDISAYVSNVDQAILLGKLMCNTRRYVRQAIEFKTYPTSDPISPGAYVYVDIGQNSWDSIQTGMVGLGGTLNVPLNNTPVNGTYNFQLYRSDRGLVTVRNVQVNNGVAATLAAYENYLFVLGVEATSRRVFRVTEVQMDEEGEITVRATHYPCTTDGLSLVADFTDNLFTVRR